MTRDNEAALLALVERLLDDENRRLQLCAGFPHLTLDEAERIIAACALAESRDAGWRAFRFALCALAAGVAGAELAQAN